MDSQILALIAIGPHTRASIARALRCLDSTARTQLTKLVDAGVLEVRIVKTKRRRAGVSVYSVPGTPLDVVIERAAREGEETKFAMWGASFGGRRSA